jgi:glycosyltransferase involved in cell wall biosynthesis
MNAFQPLVSIGIPTFNRPSALEAALKCAMNQTYTNIEIVVSDNCSTIYSFNQLAEKYRALDCRLRFYSQETNIGAIRNFEFVLNKSIGEYFFWLSDDDQINYLYVESAIEVINEAKSLNCICIPRVTIVDDNGKLVEKQFRNGYLSKVCEYSLRNRLIEFINETKYNSDKFMIFNSLFPRTRLCEIVASKVRKEIEGQDAVVSFNLLSDNCKILISPKSIYLKCDGKKECIQESPEIDWIMVRLQYISIALENTKKHISLAIILYVIWRILRKYHRPKYIVRLYKNLLQSV